MKNILLVAGVMLLLVGAVSATDCAGYFTKPADKRIKVMSAISSLELTIDRLGSRADDLYNTLDDMDSDENLTTAVDDLNDFVARKNDANDDMNDLGTAINAYDSAISASRDDLPNACFKVFNLYDSDLGDIEDYNSNVRRAWNKFIPKYDVIYTYKSSPAAYTVSVAKPKVDDIRDYIDDIYNEVTNEVPKSINATTGVTDDKIYNQTECFGMIKKNVDIAVKDCQDKCNAYVASLGGGQNCPICPNQTAGNTTCPKCQDCTSAVLQCNDNLRSCEQRYTALQSSCQTSCPVCPSVTDRDAEITRLSSELSAVSSRVTTLTSENAVLGEKLKKAEADLTAASACESCTIWKIAAIGLLILIILAWIVAL